VLRYRGPKFDLGDDQNQVDAAKSRKKVTRKRNDKLKKMKNFKFVSVYDSDQMPSECGGEFAEREQITVG